MSNGELKRKSIDSKITQFTGKKQVNQLTNLAHSFNANETAFLFFRSYESEYNKKFDIFSVSN